MLESPSSQPPRNPYFYYLLGAGVGAIVGWMVLSTEFQRIGLSIGAAIGILIARIVNRWQFNKRPPEMKVVPLGFGGHLFYLFSMILCLYMICVFGGAWLARPAEWAESLMGVLFFGAGALAVLVFWAADSRFISNWLTEARTNVVLGICSLVLALGAGYVTALGNMFWGIAGVVFFGWGGVVLFRKGTLRNRKRGQG